MTGTAPSDWTTIGYELTNGVATITLNRPDKLNAFNVTMMREMIAAFDHTDADDDVRAVIVTGAGRAYCAGADLGAGAETFDHSNESGGESSGVHRDGGGLLTLRIFESIKPVIGAINGAAVGIGVTQTLPMDIRIASDTARFGFVFARRGIVPEAASSWFLPRVVGISKAAEWCYSGRVFGATEALEAGLVRSVVAPDALLATAHELALDIAQNTSAISVALTRQMLWRMLGADHPMEAHKIDSRAVQATGATADAREGVMSFLEKRPASYTMRPSKEMPDFFPWWEDRPFE